MDRHMAEEPLQETDQPDVIRFLRSGANLAANAEAADAMNLLIREINQHPTGATTARLWSALIRQFLLQTARAADASPQTTAALTGRTVSDLMTRDTWTAQPDQTLSELVNRLFLARAITFAPVVENDALLGYVDIHMVQRIDRENWTNATVDDVIESVGPDNTVSPDLPGDVLFARITRTGRRKFLVVTGNALVGVVTLADLIAGPGVSRQLRQSPPTRA
jgi:CBS domain-containing protein